MAIRAFEHYAIIASTLPIFVGNLRGVNTEPMPMNASKFMKMACGDLSGLRELAIDFFDDTRRKMTEWRALMESGDLGQLREDLHRCKGGASLFGLERLVAMIGSCESPAFLETRGFDVNGFEIELSAAEIAVAELTE